MNVEGAADIVAKAEEMPENSPAVIISEVNVDDAQD